MRQRVYLNNDWYFSETYKQEMINATYDDSNMKKVRIPHTSKETPFHYFDEEIYQMVSGYRRIIEVPIGWKDKSNQITFEGVAQED